MKKIIFEMAIILTVSIGVALVFNYSRENGIPFFPKDKAELIIGDDILFDTTEFDTTKIKADSMLVSKNINIDSVIIKDTKQADSTLQAIDSSVKQKKQEENIDVSAIIKNAKKSKQSQFLIVTYEQMKKIIAHKDFLIIDARRPEQYQKSHIPNSINIFPLEEEGILIEKILSLPRDKTIIIYCDGGSCELSDEIATLLDNFGFKKFYIYEGGWEEWSKKQKTTN